MNKGNDEPHLVWRVNTVGLFREILLNPECAILAKPLNKLRLILGHVAERAIELDDPILNGLMCQLALYSVADPEDPENYCSETALAVIEQGRLMSEQTKKEEGL